MEKIMLEMSEKHLWEIAQLVKRITWTDMRELTVDEVETEVMRDAVVALQSELAKHGFDPR